MFAKAALCCGKPRTRLTRRASPNLGVACLWVGGRGTPEMVVLSWLPFETGTLQNTAPPYEKGMALCLSCWQISCRCDCCVWSWSTMSVLVRTAIARGVLPSGPLAERAPPWWWRTTQFLGRTAEVQFSGLHPRPFLALAPPRKGLNPKN